MDCQDVFRKISDYLDGDLDADLKRAIEQHACGCHHCEVVIDTTRQTVKLYCDGTWYVYPIQVHERLHAELKRKCRDRQV